MTTSSRRPLVAYYSRSGENYWAGGLTELQTGNTALLAQALARRTGADLYEIKTTTPYPLDYRETTRIAQNELDEDVRPELAGSLPRLSAYDEIYLGYPVWWGRAPRAVLSFVEQFDWSGKTVHLFCTHEGSGIAGSVPELRAKLVGACVDAGLSLVGHRIAEREAAVKRHFSRQ